MHLGLGLVFGAVVPGSAAAAPRRRHVFLLAGQSNATSRAAFDAGVDWPAEALQWGRNGGDDGQVVAASRPLQHHSAPQAGGMGWALQFTLDYLAVNPGVDVLLVPSAYGGTGFSDNRWNPGDDLYNDAVARVNAAMAANPNATFKGILWHQGEMDAINAASSSYEAALDAMIAGMRADISVANAATPFVLGGLGPAYAASGAEPAAVQAIIEDTPNRVAYTAYADSAGLKLADTYHFDAASYRAFGGRYMTALGSAHMNTGVNAPAAPDQVTGLTVTPGVESAAVGWSAPSNNGAAITGYTVQYGSSISGPWVTLSGTAVSGTSATISGLSGGVPVFVQVRAVNAIGSGPYSAIVSATPTAAATAPGQVTGVTVTPGDGVNALMWTAPAANGAPITDYVVEVNSGSGWSAIADGSGNGTSYTHTGLVNGTAYTYRVSAVNSVGTGSASATQSGRPASQPVAVGVETGALGHWLLGSNAETLAGGSLSTVGAAPTANAGYVSWPETRQRGYDTGIADGPTRAMCAVVRLPAPSGALILFGNNDLQTGRGVIYAHGITTFRWRTDGPGSNDVYDFDTAVPADQWMFVAVSVDGSSFVGYRGKATGAATLSQTIAPGTPKSNIGIGNIGLDHPSVNKPLDVAEFIVFDTAKSVVDFDEVYNRTKQRMAGRNITII